MLLRARHKARPEPASGRAQRVSDLQQRIADNAGLLPETQPRYHLDYVLLYLVVILTLVGLISVLSASAHVAQSQIGDASYFFKKQIVGVIVGTGALIGTLKMDIYRLPRLSRLFLAGTILLVMGTHLPVIGVTVNGSSNWLNLLGFRFQPSELAKPAMLLYLSGVLGHPQFLRMSWKQHGVSLVPVGALMFMILLQPDLGMTVVLGIALLLMYFIAGTPYWIIFGAIGAGLAGFLAKSFSTPYQQARITYWLDPWSDPQGQGFQLIQSMIAIGSGGLTGNGFGQSVQKLFYLPEQHTDFIFSVIAEEFGFLGVCLLLVLFAWLTQRGIRIACKSPTPYLKLMATGLTCTISLQAFVNIAVVCGVLPTTGLTLPFISYGSTSLVVTLICMGLLLNISRHIPPPRSEAGAA
ncbi:MAG: putative lipid II flippase FtsW [Candidatus Sericytochromatia bacterium]